MNKRIHVQGCNLETPAGIQQGCERAFVAGAHKDWAVDVHVSPLNRCLSQSLPFGKCNRLPGCHQVGHGLQRIDTDFQNPSYSNDSHVKTLPRVDICRRRIWLHYISTTITHCKLHRSSYSTQALTAGQHAKTYVVQQETEYKHIVSQNTACSEPLLLMALDGLPPPLPPLSLSSFLPLLRAKGQPNCNGRCKCSKRKNGAKHTVRALPA